MRSDADTVRLSVRRPDGPVTGLALVLPGGKVRSRARPQPWHLAAARMVPFARALEQAGGTQGLAVASLLYRYRGWNGDEASPVADTRRALERLRADVGDVPVAIVGHSMGGRTALRCADAPSVVGVVALAPWIERDEPVAQLAGRRLLILHGGRDRWTDPKASLAYVQRAVAVAASASRVEIAGDRHAMIGRPRLWHELTTGFVLAALGSPELAGLGEGQSESRDETNTSQVVLRQVWAGQLLSDV